ncbi:MFS general substrate transporter [Nemania sp. FL0916]|nr:MFS general substrate transporter [Nemania sp. FL0916]
MAEADIEKANGATPAMVKPSDMPGDEAERRFQPKSFKFWSVIISIFLALFLVALDRTIVGTATPHITRDFHSPGDIGWYGSAYQLTTAASQLLFGRIYKFCEIKKTFLITVVVFEIGSVICGAASSSVAFIVGRAIAGVGGAGIFSGVTIIMITMVPLQKRPMFQGLFGMVFGLASVLGPLVGGALTDAISWRWCFYINLPIGAVAGLCLIFILHTSEFPHPPATIWEQIQRLDPLGTFLFVPSIVSLLLALQWGGSTYAWSDWRIIVLLILFGILFIAFGAVQVTMPKTATVPVRIIRKRSILAAAIFMFALAGSFLMVIFYLPVWFQVVKGATATQSGVYTLPFVLSLVAGSILSGAFTQKIGYYVPAMIASPTLLAIGQGLISTFTVDEASSHWIGYQVVAGFGLGLGMQASNLAAQAVLPMPDVPIGIAIMFFVQQLGGGIFTSVGQNLLSTYLVSYLHVPGISKDQIMGEGATDLVASVAPEYQLDVKIIYNQALSQIFRCAMGVALIAVVAAVFMEWKNIKKGGPPPGARSVPGPQVHSTEFLKREGSSELFIDLSPRLSSEEHSNNNRKCEKPKMNGAMDVEAQSVPSPSRQACEHCEHCRLSCALTLTPTERQSLSSGPNDSNQHLPVYPTNTPSPETLEEAARLASVARAAQAQLEELTRPYSGLGAYMGRHSVDSAVALPGRAYLPHDSAMRHSYAAPSPWQRDPTTPELAGNARRVSAHLEGEDRESKVRQRDGRTERQQEAPRRQSDQSSRPLSTIISSTSSLEGSRFPPRDTR